MNIQGWDVYLSQAFFRQSNSRRVVRLLREMRCVLHEDRRIKVVKTAMRRRTIASSSSESTDALT